MGLEVRVADDERKSVPVLRGCFEHASAVPFFWGAAWDLAAACEHI